MGMTNKRALELGFDFKLYNPFICKGDFVGITFIIMLLLSCAIGFFYKTKFFLGLSLALGLAMAFVSLFDFLSAERIKQCDAKRGKDER